MNIKKFSLGALVVLGATLLFFDGKFFLASRAGSSAMTALKDIFADGSSEEYLADLSQEVAESSSIQENVPKIVERPPQQRTQSVSRPSVVQKKISAVPKGETIASETIFPTTTSLVPVVPLQNAASSSFATSPAPVCAFPAATSSPVKIIFNEVAWMGSSENPKDEWIEFKNISTESVDLFGWQLTEAAGKVKGAIAEHRMLPPQGFFLFARASTTVSFAPEYFFSGDLLNSGSKLALVDLHCGAADILDATGGWPGGDNATKQTLERDVNGMSWHTSVISGGTPQRENSIPPQAAVSTPGIPLAPPATVSSSSAAANSSSLPVEPTTTPSATVPDASSTEASSDVPTHILIAALQVAGSSTANDFIKLYNPADTALSVGGWKLRKRAKTGAESSLREFPASSTIAAHGYFLWANSLGGFSETIQADVSSTETLAADNSVGLIDVSGTLIDAVAWGSGMNQYIEGTAYPDNPGAGALLRRKAAAQGLLDTGNNAADFELAL